LQSDLRVRLRNYLDKDIKAGIEQLGPLEQGELSELIRNGMRLALKERGIVNGHSQNTKTNSQGNQGVFYFREV